MKDRDGFPVLFYITDPDVETVTGLREATVRDHVAAFIAEGGETIWWCDVHRASQLIEGHACNRWSAHSPCRMVPSVIFPIPVESAEANGESPEVPT